MLNETRGVFSSVQKYGIEVDPLSGEVPARKESVEARSLAHGTGAPYSLLLFSIDLTQLLVFVVPPFGQSTMVNLITLYVGSLFMSQVT